MALINNSKIYKCVNMQFMKSSCIRLIFKILFFALIRSFRLFIFIYFCNTMIRFANTCRKIAEKLQKNCRKIAEKLQKNCGKNCKYLARYLILINPHTIYV